MTTVAVIGTGNMGSPMAINLARAGLQVCAYDIVGDKTSALVRHGIVACSSHREAVENAGFVLTMLPAGEEVRDVYLNQVLGHAPADCIMIDSSTIDLNDAQAIHKAAKENNYLMLDAPVSGGTAGAAAGKLTFMVGGEESTMEASRNVLDAMGARIIYCGEGGMGQAAKMCNNMMLGIQMASVAEGFQLARRVGLSDQKLYDVASSSSANCFSLTAFCPVPDVVETCPANNEFRPGFSTDLMLKDMRLALSAATRTGITFDLAPVAASLYEAFSDTGNGGLDFSGVFRMLEQRYED